MSYFKINSLPNKTIIGMMTDEHMVVKNIIVALCAAYTLNSFAKMNSRRGYSSPYGNPTV